MTALPNYAVSPGEYLDEWMDDNYLTVEKLAEEMGFSVDEVNDFLSDNPSPMTVSFAVLLFEATGIRVETWLSLEALYRSDLARLAGQKTIEIAPEDTVEWNI